MFYGVIQKITLAQFFLRHAYDRPVLSDSAALLLYQFSSFQSSEKTWKFQFVVYKGLFPLRLRVALRGRNATRSRNGNKS